MKNKIMSSKKQKQLLSSMLDDKRVEASKKAIELINEKPKMVVRDKKYRSVCVFIRNELKDKPNFLSYNVILMSILKDSVSIDVKKYVNFDNYYSKNILIDIKNYKEIELIADKFGLSVNKTTSILLNEFFSKAF